MPPLTDPVLPEESGSVDAALGQRLVDIARPGHSFERAWRIGEGVKAVSWLFDVEGAPTVVAKFFRPESEERMSRELGFHAACTLEDNRLPVLLGSQRPIPDEQLGVVMTNCLMGQRLADGAGATEADKRLVYEQSSTLLKKLHNSPLHGFAMQGDAASKSPIGKGDSLHGFAMQEDPASKTPMSKGDPLHGKAMQENPLNQASDSKPDPLHGKAMQENPLNQASNSEGDPLHGKAMQEPAQQPAQAPAQQPAQQPTQGFGPLGAPPTHADARSFAASLAEEAIERRQRIGENPALTDHLTGWLRERSASVDPQIPAVLCHGDYSMWNMLVEWREGRHQLTGVFDFESSYVGDPLMELASAWVLTDSWGGPGEAELQAIERGYGAARAGREDDFELYVVLEKLKLWSYYAERGALEAAGDVDVLIARQIGR